MEKSDILDKITIKYLRDCFNDPLPEGYEERFGITGCKFVKYKNLQDLEDKNMEFNGKEWSPFGYNEPNYQEKKKKFLPDDEFWLINDCFIHVIRNGQAICKEYRTMLAMPWGTEKTFLHLDPDYVITLQGL